MILVFGNGLSVGFDSRLTTESITGRVVASLGDSYAGVLRDLAKLGTPEDPDTAPVGVARGGFEQLAGSVDRLADALVGMQRLFTGSSTSPLLAGLREAADGLRQHYVRIMGTVLREVDAAASPRSRTLSGTPRGRRWTRSRPSLSGSRPPCSRSITTRCSCRRS